jgi:hypothetical protein
VCFSTICRFATAVEQLTLQPVKTISGTVKLPGSKSLSNRILLLAALAEGTTVVKNLLVGVANRIIDQSDACILD